MKINTLHYNLKLASVFKKLLLIITFCLLGNITNLFAQEQINFYFNKNKSEIKADKTENSRIHAEFFISGLSSQQDFEQFAKLFIGNKSFKSFTISEEIIKDKRKANIVFFNFDGFKELLVNAKVQKIVFLDQEFLVKDLDAQTLKTLFE